MPHKMHGADGGVRAACMRAAPLQMPQRHMSRANSNSSNGLLSHAMRNGGGGSNEGNAAGNGRGELAGVVANGNGYSSRHSSEYSNDDEWDGVSHQQQREQHHQPQHREARPASTSASSKVRGSFGRVSLVSCKAYREKHICWGAAKSCMHVQPGMLRCDKQSTQLSSCPDMVA